MGVLQTHARQRQGRLKNKNKSVSYENNFNGWLYLAAHKIHRSNLKDFFWQRIQKERLYHCMLEWESFTNIVLMWNWYLDNWLEFSNQYIIRFHSSGYHWKKGLLVCLFSFNLYSITWLYSYFLNLKTGSEVEETDQYL